jgi:hypothetical protein
MATFSATVENWVKASHIAMEAIAKSSTQEVVRLMRLPKTAGGHMPIDTSFLQNSLVGSTSSMPQVDPKADGSSGPDTGNFSAIEGIIASWTLGQTMYLGFTANYAEYQNYGTVFFAGNHFVELAVQQWSTIVKKEEQRMAAAML